MWCGRHAAIEGRREAGGVSENGKRVCRIGKCHFPRAPVAPAAEKTSEKGQNWSSDQIDWCIYPFWVPCCAAVAGKLSQRLSQEWCIRLCGYIRPPTRGAPALCRLHWDGTAASWPRTPPPCPLPSLMRRYGIFSTTHAVRDASPALYRVRTPSTTPPPPSAISNEVVWPFFNHACRLRHLARSLPSATRQYDYSCTHLSATIVDLY